MPIKETLTKCQCNIALAFNQHSMCNIKALWKTPNLPIFSIFWILIGIDRHWSAFDGKMTDSGYSEALSLHIRLTALAIISMCDTVRGSKLSDFYIWWLFLAMDIPIAIEIHVVS